MYPVLFEIFGFPISTFGVMLAIAFLTGTWLVARRMQELGIDPEKATTVLLYAMIGGIGGSKLYFAIDVSLREDIPFTQLLFAREGAAVVVADLVPQGGEETLRLVQGEGGRGLFVQADVARAADCEWSEKKKFATLLPSPYFFAKRFQSRGPFVMS